MSYPTAIFSTALVLGAFFTAFGQSSSKPPADWFIRDPETDQLQGVSAEKAYNSLLKGRPSRTIIVAVVDSGIDIGHEDLKTVLWTNVDEIPGNGIDDDKNGYIDDIHGWNFIGGKDGNVNEDTYEVTREYARLSKMFANVDEGTIGRKEKKDYENYKKIKDKYTTLRDKNKQDYDLYRTLYTNFRMSADTLKAAMKVEKISRASLDTFKTTNPTLSFSKGFILTMVNRMGPDTEIEETLRELNEGLRHFQVIVEYGYNQDFDSRQIVGDTYSNPNERIYGNNDVKGPDAEHGTHVAGIIAADRTNEKGIKGIADNVRIMSVRAIPNGDERDKDVANAIRYAVDNGANIINMSFGKDFSPEKKVVDEAVNYAAKKGVLLVHAAGNDGKDLDKEKEFPSRFFLGGEEAKNWLEVGASAWGPDESFVAYFSNYGKKTVDLFAPGVDIYSAVPGNSYKKESGTSMASPAASGVAAMLWSYFPELTVTQLIDVLKKSTRKFDRLQVRKPGGGKTDFNLLSNTGGLVNAYEAVKMAIDLKGQKVD